MSISLQPRWDEESSNETLIDQGGGAVVKYFVYSDKDETQGVLRTAVKNLTPSSNGLWARSSVSIEGRISDNSGAFIWGASVEYSHHRNDPDKYRYEIRSSGGTTLQMTLSGGLLEEQVKPDNEAYELDNTAAEQVLGIKSTDAENGTSLTYQGIPVQKPGIEVSVSFWRSSDKWDEWQAKIIDGVTRTVVNGDAPPYKFLGVFEYGSLRFISFQAVPDADEMGWRVVCGFEYSAAPDMVQVNGRLGSAGIAPLVDQYHGHDYLDILSMPGVEPVKKLALAQPVRAAVHRIYDYVNYRTLFAPMTPTPTGSCVYGTGPATCEIMTELACGDLDGVWTLNGTCPP